MPRSARMLAVEAVKLYLLDERRTRRYGCPTPEYRFAAPYRQWRLDLAYVAYSLAIEVEGGTHAHAPDARSRHTTGTGYRDDCVKYAIAGLLGWCVLRLTTDMVEDGTAWTLLDAALEMRRMRYHGSAAPDTALSTPMRDLILAMPPQYVSRAKREARRARLAS